MHSRKDDIAKARQRKSRRAKAPAPHRASRRSIGQARSTAKHNGAISRFQPGSLGEYIAMLYRLPSGTDVLTCPEWPPDLFAIVGAILKWRR